MITVAGARRCRSIIDHADLAGTCVLLGRRPSLLARTTKAARGFVGVCVGAQGDRLGTNGGY